MSDPQIISGSSSHSGATAVANPVSIRLPTTESHSPPCPTDALLDHNMYPHIMDLIVECAPGATLVVLRATSRSFHKRCDVLLSRHIVISNRRPVAFETTSTPSWPVTISSRGAPHPIFYRWNQEPMSIDGSSMPRPPVTPRTARVFKGTKRRGPLPMEVQQQPCALALSDTRTLDIVGPVPYPHKWLLLGIHKHKVALRFRYDDHGGSPWSQPPGWRYDESNSGYPARVDRIVTFEHLNGPQVIEEPVSPTPNIEGGVLPSFEVLMGNGPHSSTRSLRGTDRVVHNLIFTEREELRFMPIFNYAYTATEVFIVFQRRGPEIRQPPPRRRPTLHLLVDDDIPNYPDIFRTLESIAQCLVHNPERKVTFVNLGVLNPKYFLLHEKAEQADLQREVLETFQGCIHHRFRTIQGITYLGPLTSQERTDLAMKNLAFLTWDEYRATLSATEFEIETEESAD